MPPASSNGDFSLMSLLPSDATAVLLAAAAATVAALAVLPALSRVSRRKTGVVAARSLSTAAAPQNTCTESTVARKAVGSYNKFSRPPLYHSGYASGSPDHQSHRHHYHSHGHWDRKPLQVDSYAPPLAPRSTTGDKFASSPRARHANVLAAMPSSSVSSSSPSQPTVSTTHLGRLCVRGQRNMATATTALFATSSSTTSDLSTTTAPMNDLPVAPGPLDARLVAEAPEVVEAHLKARGADAAVAAATVEAIGRLQAERSTLLKRRDEALAERKRVSASVGQIMRNPDLSAEEKAAQSSDLKSTAEAAGAAGDAAASEVERIEGEIATQLLAMPNLVHPSTPRGKDDTENVLVKEWMTDHRLIGIGAGAPLPSATGNGDSDSSGTAGQETGNEHASRVFPMHDDVAAMLGGYDPEAAVAMAGARFSVLTGPVARLWRALGEMMLDMHTEKHGYTEANVPLIVTAPTLRGTGQLPKFEEDLFKTSHAVGDEATYLIPTAEVPLTNTVRGQILPLARLPIKLTSRTPCFRAEAGSHGRDTRGLLRQHQFDKVELVAVAAPADSEAVFHDMVAHAEAVLQALELPYRVVQLCSGDLGFSAQRCFDLEVWMPGQQRYFEISSVSHCGEFQARRMALRYRPETAGSAAEGTEKGKKKNSKKGGGAKPEFCHTMNGSGVAIGRALAAVLETHVLEDGSGVRVPQALRPYLGGKEVLRAAE